MSKPIKADAKTNLAVAKAVGIKATIHTYPGESPMCVCEKTEGDDYARSFSPTTYWDDAMEAAKLFLARTVGTVNHLRFINTLIRILGATDSPDLLREERVLLLFFSNDNTPLAICEAILAVAEKGGNDV